MTSSFPHQSTYQLSPCDREIIASEVSSSLNIPSYARQSDLGSFVTRQQMQDKMRSFEPSRCVTHEELSDFDYVQHSYISRRDYVSASSLKAMGHLNAAKVTAIVDKALIDNA